MLLLMQLRPRRTNTTSTLLMSIKYHKYSPFQLIANQGRFYP